MIVINLIIVDDKKTLSFGNVRVFGTLMICICFRRAVNPVLVLDSSFFSPSVFSRLLE
jgi:hypothetical protein